jgi:stage II sporulation protein AA (anti-sigma F factor antagonist)
MTGGDLTISHDLSDGVEVIRLEGDVDLTNADVLREAVDATTAGRVVLDLSGVTFLDSTAIATLHAGQQRLASEQRALVVVSPPETPSAWTLRVTGMDGKVCGSLDEALVAELARHARA